MLIDSDKTLVTRGFIQAALEKDNIKSRSLCKPMNLYPMLTLSCKLTPDPQRQIRRILKRLSKKRIHDICLKRYNYNSCL